MQPSSDLPSSAKDLPMSVSAPRHCPRPHRSTAPHAALRRRDRRGEIRRPRHGRRSIGAQILPRDIVLLEQTAINPVVVHGGGPQIGDDAQASSASNRSSPAGCASPTQETVEVVEMVLAGSINKQIVGLINAEGGKADRAVRQGRQHGDRRARLTRTVVDPDSNIEQVLDLGFVGEPVKVEPTVLDRARPRDDPGAGAGRARPRRRAPTTSMPIRLPAPSPAR